MTDALTLRFFGGSLAGSVVVGSVVVVSLDVPGTSRVSGSVIRLGGVEEVVTRSSILMVCGWGVGGSSMMVGLLSMAEMSKSMFSMVNCQHARDGHAMMEKELWLVVFGKAACPQGGRASVAFMNHGTHSERAVPTEHTLPGMAANRTLRVVSLQGLLNQTRILQHLCRRRADSLLSLAPWTLGSSPLSDWRLISSIPTPALCWTSGSRCSKWKSGIRTCFSPLSFASNLHLLLISALKHAPLRRIRV